MKLDRVPKQKADCYSQGERRAMEWGQRLRADMLRPCLLTLTKLKVTADHITVLGLSVGLAFVPCFLLSWYGAAAFLLALHVLFDGLDGPLARYQRTDSPRGSLTDSLSDQIVLTGVVVAWILQNSSSWNIALGVVFVFLYTLVVAVAMVRNALLVPYDWLLRPRFFVFASVCLDSWLYWHLTPPVVFISSSLLAFSGISGFLALRGILPGPVVPPAKADSHFPQL